MNTNILTMIEQAEVEWKPIEEVFNIRNGYTPSKTNKSYWENGTIPWFRLEDIRKNGRVLNSAIQCVNESGIKGNLFPANSIMMSTTATIGEHALITVDYLSNQQISNFSLKKEYANLLNMKFVFYYFFIFSEKSKKSINNSSMPSVQMSELKKWLIPIPPLELQKEIVKRLDILTELEATLEATLEAELILRKKQYRYYRDFLLSENELVKVGFEWKTLGSITSYEQPTKYLVKSKDYNDDFQTPVLTAGKTFILGYTNETNGIYQASKNPVIIFDDFTTANKWVDFDFKAKSSAMKMIASIDEKQVLLKYIYYWLNTLPSGLIDGDHKRQWISNFTNKKIPIPPLQTQAKIVAILDKFDRLTSSITDGLPKEIELRRKQYEYYRELLLGFENDTKI